MYIVHLLSLHFIVIVCTATQQGPRASGGCDDKTKLTQHSKCAIYHRKHLSVTLFHISYMFLHRVIYIPDSPSCIVVVDTSRDTLAPLGKPFSSPLTHASSSMVKVFPTKLSASASVLFSSSSRLCGHIM